MSTFLCIHSILKQPIFLPPHVNNDLVSMRLQAYLAGRKFLKKQ